MRSYALIALGVVALGGPALAQTAPVPEPAAPSTGGAPIDRGPLTPDANRAFMGGGAVLQGPPGAPAPPPMQLAPSVVPPDAPPPSRVR